MPPFLGLLAYWIVNIIRHQLKKENEKRKKADPDPKAEYPTPYWTEIVDIMKTQKVVKSEAINTLGEKGHGECAHKEADRHMLGHEEQPGWNIYYHGIRWRGKEL